MSKNAARLDDTIPVEYRYTWSPGGTLSIEDFVAKVFVQVTCERGSCLTYLQYKPSMVQNDGTKPVGTCHPCCTMQR